MGSNTLCAAERIVRFVIISGQGIDKHEGLIRRVSRILLKLIPKMGDTYLPFLSPVNSQPLRSKPPADIISLSEMKDLSSTNYLTLVVQLST